MVHSFICINMGNHFTNSCTYKIKLSATTFKIKTRKNYLFQSFLSNTILSNIFLVRQFRLRIKMTWILRQKRGMSRANQSSSHFYF